jgi:hypothetical protein
MTTKTRINPTGIFLPAALAALLLFAPALRADGLEVGIAPGVTASAGSMGNTFDVLLTNTGASAVTLGGFSFGIVTADTDITFTDATTSTSAPYVFAGDSFDDIFGFTLYTNSLPGQTVEASDVSNSGAGESIASGATVGLGSVVFDVASGATPGSFAVTFEDYPTTSLSDPSANNLDFISEDGTITITGVGAVPEPPTGELLICAVGSAILIRQRRTDGIAAKST